MSHIINTRHNVMETTYVIHNVNNQNKRRRLNESEALYVVIGGGRILDPSQKRRKTIPQDDVSAQADGGAVMVVGGKKVYRPLASLKRLQKAQVSTACTCCTLAYLVRDIERCPAPRHNIRQITSKELGMGSSLRMCYESEDSIFESLRPFLGTGFSQLRTMIIRRDVLQPINMNLGLLQCLVNKQTGGHSFDVRTRYDKKSCVVQVGLRLLREAQNLQLGFQFFSIEEDSTKEAHCKNGRCLRRTIEVRISKNRGPSTKTPKEREEVYQELLGIVFESREQDIQWAEELYTWLASKGAELIA